MPLEWTAREIARAANELTTLLAHAHHQLNKLGYPPATRPIDEETSCGTYINSPLRDCPDPAVHPPWPPARRRRT